MVVVRVSVTHARVRELRDTDGELAIFTTVARV